jgi:hypothetical protein
MPPKWRREMPAWFLDWYRHHRGWGPAVTLPARITAADWMAAKWLDWRIMRQGLPPQPGGISRPVPAWARAIPPLFVCDPIVRSPGFLTVEQQPQPDLTGLVRYGWEWLAFQLQNGDGVAGGGVLPDFDLAPATAAGLKPAAWGVTYTADAFYRDGEALGLQAAVRGARALIVNAEQCAKNTRATRGLAPIVAGIRAGGWRGPVNLCTLGAPTDPDRFDFEVDVASFLETGGGLFVEAYGNAYPCYEPDRCVRYWTRVGVPIDRLNLMIELAADAGQPRRSGAEWASKLEGSGMGPRQLSGFMAEDLEPGDLAALAPLTR